MRRTGVVVFALVLVLSVALPAWAQVAAIETTATLADHSERATEAAFRQAVESAVRGAAAMGLPWVELRHARVLSDRVSILLLASDVEPDDEDDAPDAGPEAGILQHAALDV